MIKTPLPLFYSTHKLLIFPDPQGDRGNGMYFVETGTLVVLKQIDGEEKEVNHAECQDEMFPYLIASLYPPGE